MAKLPYRLDAFAKREDDPLRPFSLEISEPEPHPEFGYQCVIDCPLIREKKFTLFGHEPLFTAELCVQFVKRLLQFSETEVVDENGHLVEFPSFDDLPDVPYWEYGDNGDREPDGMAICIKDVDSGKQFLLLDDVELSPGHGPGLSKDRSLFSAVEIGDYISEKTYANIGWSIVTRLKIRRASRSQKKS